MNLSDALSQLGKSLKSIAKVILLSRRATLRPEDRAGRPIIVMGNGPSLNQTIDEHSDILTSNDTMAVNFAGISPQFFDLKPRYYILVDPFFFSGESDNLTRLHRALSSVDWTMTLIVPVKAVSSLPAAVSQNSHIEVRTINTTGVEGWRWLKNMMFGRGLGMPRPRNVLIPAIMSAVRLGYNTIHIVGADHSWMKTLDVDNENRVISVQPHFYKDNAKEQKRVNSEYEGYRLHQIILSFYVAFKSYHEIQDYASTHNVTILNSTPESFIDAFPRRPLPGA